MESSRANTQENTMANDVIESERLATSLESNGSRAIKKNPPSVISNQLRDELIRILKTGDDKHDGAFTIAVAAQVEKFVAAAREILMTENLAQQDVASLMMMRRPYLGGSYGLIGGSAFGPETGLPLSSVNNENFGVQVIRQLVDAIGTASESPAKLVEALAAARSNNLTDVVAVLEKKLGVSKVESVHGGKAPQPEEVS
jgi:hypothetical protein